MATAKRIPPHFLGPRRMVGEARPGMSRRRNGMRRNLTISFADDFIVYMDSQRGKTSRGVWLELNCPGPARAPAKADRSPEPDHPDAAEVHRSPRERAEA